MESILFILDCIGMVIVCFMSMRDDRLKVNELHTSWFRYRGEKGDVDATVVDKSQERLRKLQKKYSR